MKTKLIIKKPTNRLLELHIEAKDNKVIIREYWASGLVTGHITKLKNLSKYLRTLGIPEAKVDMIIKKIIFG